MVSAPTLTLTLTLNLSPSMSEPSLNMSEPSPSLSGESAGVVCCRIDDSDWLEPPYTKSLPLKPTSKPVANSLAFPWFPLFTAPSISRGPTSL